jgi:RimJ/RimL family protein N-acetyltransferase
MDEKLQTQFNPAHRLDLARALGTPIKELGESERPLYYAHLASLGEQDRYLRFGSPLSDAAIESYVERIDFSTDTLFGVFDDALNLAAAGHFAPINTREEEDDPRLRSAEFGLSVSEGARGKGLGTALFLRAAAHARNLGIGMLFMHCLSENRAMMHIARKAGMEIQQTHGEADAYLALKPGDIASAIEEGVQRQIALFDFAVKRQLLIAKNAFKKRTSVANPA